jgi:hypothetical protein
VILPSPQLRASLAVLATPLVLLFVGCGGEQGTEAQVRAYVDRVVEAVEERAWRSFGEYFADAYQDRRGLSKDEVIAVLARHVLAHQRIYVLRRVASVQIGDPHDARVVVYAAMAGRPLSGPQDLARLAADVYRFEIDLRAGPDGEFRTVRSDWQAVALEQFLIGD